MWVATTVLHKKHFSPTPEVVQAQRTKERKGVFYEIEGSDPGSYEMVVQVPYRFYP